MWQCVISCCQPSSLSQLTSSKLKSVYILQVNRQEVNASENLSSVPHFFGMRQSREHVSERRLHYRMAFRHVASWGSSIPPILLDFESNITYDFILIGHAQSLILTST